MKSHYDVELEKVKKDLKDVQKRSEKQINSLNEEMKRIGIAKVELVESTSKEIDSLRQLLSDYVRIANQHRNRNNR